MDLRHCLNNFHYNLSGNTDGCFLKETVQTQDFVHQQLIQINLCLYLCVKINLGQNIEAASC